MKKVAILACFLLVACAPSGPSESEIATQVAEGTIATLAASAPTPSPTLAPTDTPMPTRIPPPVRAVEFIYRNGVILTMETEYPEAQAIAIHGEKIVAVGSDQEIMALQGPETQVIDLQGRTLMPGFVDAHSHLFNAAGQWGLDLEGAQRVALERGITSLANMFTTKEFLSEMEAFSESGRLKIRTSLYLNYNTNCGNVLGDWYRNHEPTRFPGEMLRIGGVKIFADGGSCGHPAVSYDHPAFGFGDLWFTQEELNDVISDTQASGRQAAIHALGDRAVEQALNAVEFALDGKANTLRHRIEHNALVRDDLLERYSDVGVIALIFGAYPICASDVAPPPADQDGWEWRWRDLIERNPHLHFAWHSDMHTPLFAQISPLQHLFSMVSPFEVASDGTTICDTPSWLPAAKTLPVEEALPMMTIEGAYALFREEEVGSIRPGKFADLIIVSGNPLAVEPEEIIDLKILMTMVGGHVEYCDPGHAELCPGAYRARIKITTTSDWTTFGVVSGGSWLRPSLVSANGEATYAGLEGDRFLLTQPLTRAEVGGRVEMVVDIFFADLDPEGMLVFEIERGHLGSTQVELHNYLGSEPVVIETFWWDGINPDERNTLTVQTPAAGLLGSTP